MTTKKQVEFMIGFINSELESDGGFYPERVIQDLTEMFQSKGIDDNLDLITNTVNKQANILLS